MTAPVEKAVFAFCLQSQNLSQFSLSSERSTREPLTQRSIKWLNKFKATGSVLEKKQQHWETSHFGRKGERRTYELILSSPKKSTCVASCELNTVNNGSQDST